jgi:inorganic pyrophosphatase
VPAVRFNPVQVERRQPMNEPTFTGCMIEARPIGLFRMADRGKSDFKLLAIPNTDPLFDEYRGLNDVPSHFLREVEHFFATYKQWEGVKIKTHGWQRADAAIEEIASSARKFTDAQ